MANDVQVSVSIEDIEIAVELAGPAGPQGPPGAGDKHFEQAFVGTNVTVTHNLGKYPAVTIFTSAGDEVEGDVEHLSANQLQVSFGNSFSGTVICN